MRNFVYYRWGRLLSWLPRPVALALRDAEALLRHRLAPQRSLPRLRRKLRAQYYRHFQLAHGVGAQRHLLAWAPPPEPALLVAWHCGPSYLVLDALAGADRPCLALLGEGTGPGQFGSLRISHLDRNSRPEEHARQLREAYESLRAGESVVLMFDANFAVGKPLINPAVEFLARRCGARVIPLAAVEQPLNHPTVLQGPPMQAGPDLVTQLAAWFEEVKERYPEDVPEFSAPPGRD